MPIRSHINHALTQRKTWAILPIQPSFVDSQSEQRPDATCIQFAMSRQQWTVVPAYAGFLFCSEKKEIPAAKTDAAFFLFSNKGFLKLPAVHFPCAVDVQCDSNTVVCPNSQRNSQRVHRHSCNPSNHSLCFWQLFLSRSR